MTVQTVKCLVTLEKKRLEKQVCVQGFSLHCDTEILILQKRTLAFTK